MNVYEEAINAWGVESQLDQVTEELAELIVAINKYRRFKHNGIIDVLDEIADVEIMMEQLKCIINKDFPCWQEAIENIKTTKLQRISNFINEKASQINQRSR